MEMRNSLIAITQAVSTASNSMGSVESRSHVERVIADPYSADSLDLYTISGMQLGEFYDHSYEDFPASDEFWGKMKDHLPPHISLQLDGKPRIKLPKPGKKTTLAQLAVFLADEVE